MIPLFIFAAIAADLPSFTCGPANGITEAAICADPELAAHDRAMGMIWEKLPTKDIAQQKSWLTKRNKCGARRGCIMNAYIDWIGAHVWSVAPRYERVSSKQTPSSLSLLPLGDGRYAFAINAAYIYRANGEETANDGGASGVIRLTDGGGRFPATPLPYECSFELSRKGAAWVVKASTEMCGGVNVSLDGTYVAKRKP